MRLSYFKTKRAFTLAELFVVIGILIIIAVPILLSYHSYMQKKNLELSAQEVQSALYEARDMSLAPKVSPGEIIYGYGIYFNLTSKSYSICKELDNSKAIDRPSEFMSSSKTYKLRGDVMFLKFVPSASTASVVFALPDADTSPYSKKSYFNGQSSGTGTIKLGYADETDQYRIIKIDLATNLISIEEE